MHFGEIRQFECPELVSGCIENKGFDFKAVLDTIFCTSKLLELTVYNYFLLKTHNGLK